MKSIAIEFIYISTFTSKYYYARNRYSVSDILNSISKALNFNIFNFELKNSIEIKYDFALYSKGARNKFFKPKGDSTNLCLEQLKLPDRRKIPSSKRITWKWKLYRSRSGFLGVPIQLIAPGERRQFVQLCNGRTKGRTITACRGDYGVPNEPYPIVVAVGAIVVCPLSKIENLVSRQTVPVLVELHQAAGVVCKIVTIVMTADSAASPETTFGSRTELTTRSERR